MDFYEARKLVGKYDTRTYKIDDISWVTKPEQEVPTKIKSLMVESYLLGLPLDTSVLKDVDYKHKQPLYKNESSVYWVRGNSFLYSLQSFKRNEFKLEGLQVLNELNDLTYKDLDAYTQRKFIHQGVRVIVVEPDFPVELISKLSISTYV
jgi:hypothetical protein